MSIDFTTLFQKNRSYETGKNSSVFMENNAILSQEKSARLSALAPGSTVCAQVVASDGEHATIRLGDHSLLEAKLEGGAILRENTSVFFEVKGVSSNGNLVLRSLFQNTAMGQTAQNALMQANIPANDAALRMVSAMMEQGMSIDKKSLLAMYRQVSAHPHIGSENVVTMNRFQIPLTDENSKQLKAYMNLEHQISKGVKDIAASFESMLFSLQEAKDESGLLAIRQMTRVLMDETAFEDGFVQEKTALEDCINKIIKQDLGKPFQPEKMLFVQKEAREGDAVSGKQASLILQKDLLSNEQANRNDLPVIQDKLTAHLRDLGLPDAVISKLFDTKDQGMLLYFAKSLMEQASSDNRFCAEDFLRDFFSDTRVEKALQNLLEEKWLLSPESVSKKEMVEHFYESLRHDMGRLSNQLEMSLSKNDVLFQQVSNLNENLDFLHQLNQTMSYIQLPLKLAGNETHGDLYVYTNKKNLAEKDGLVSAFLRLDMEHLGTVDVYVALQNQNVTTNFYLADEQMLDFVSENIPMLNERLEKLGYHMDATVSQRQKDTNVMQEILDDHREHVLIATQSFDVRA